MTTTLGSAPPETAFLWKAPVYFDDLDAMGMLHNAHYAVLLDRAITAYFESHGLRWELEAALNPDQHWAVRRQALEYFVPHRGVGAIEVALSVSMIGSTSATYSAQFRGGEVLLARSERTVVRIDIATGRPTPWTEQTRAQLTAIAVTSGGAPV